MRDLPLPEDDLASALEALPTWYVEAGKLTTRRELASFLGAVAFVGQVAEIAERLDHHPDIDLRWRTVVLAVNTHDSGGAITAQDITLARQIDALG